MRGPLALAIAVSLGGPLLSASAGFEEQALLDEVAFNGNAYVAWRLRGPPGAEARLVAHIDPDDAPIYGEGVWVVAPDGTVTGGIGMGFGLTEVRLGAQAIVPRPSLAIEGPG